MAESRDKNRVPVQVQADLGMKLDELVSVQLCLFLFNPVFHACVYLFYLIQFFMHARRKTRMCILDQSAVHGLQQNAP